ncbi:MAG: amidohydrolase [Pseudomonadota bacterium]|jgi:amidohydrolase
MPQSRLAAIGLALAVLLPPPASAAIGRADLEREFAAVRDQLIAWRRDIHQNPELGNRETRTAALVAGVLKDLKLDSVRTGVAYTGVVGVLEGGKPGPVIALRADMDALPVTEATGLPFASKVTTTFRGETVGVMHACGHDTHVANLLATATVLSRLRADLPGTVMFIFQPAEEGAPEGEEGGAELMLKEGLFADLKPEAVMGLHVTSNLNTGRIGWRAGPLMAAVDSFTITVKGVQTHGSRPWQGVDPITTAAQIITGVNTIVSRQLDITDTPAVVSFGAIKGGIRENIIPDQVEMIGTIRTFQPEHRVQIFDRLKRTAESIAASQGATATVDIQQGYPVTVNEQRLTERMLPTLRRVAGEANVVRIPLTTGAEDFSYYAQEVPGLFVFVGVTDPAIDPRKAPTNHSPLFLVDEAALPLALDALVSLAVDYLQGG